MRIVDFSGANLLEAAPEPRTIKASGDSGGVVTIQVIAIEDTPQMPVRSCSGTLFWNDGTPPQVFSVSISGTLSVNESRLLPVGNHVVRFLAHNYKSPTPDYVSVNFEINVVPRVQLAEPKRYLAGPILPKDEGFPNAQQWCFNTGYDVDVLSSGVKMLLSTSIGERLMLPGYGTNLKALLFQPIADGLQEMAQREIDEALRLWEPRVKLQGLTVMRESPRSVTIRCSFVVRATEESFTTQSTFSL